MKTTTLLILLVLIATVLTQNTGNKPQASKIHKFKKGVPGSYIIVYKTKASVAKVAAKAKSAQFKGKDALELASMKMISTEKMNDVELDAVAADEDVDYIEQVQLGEIDTCNSYNARSVWGLDRIDQRRLPLNNVYKPIQSNPTGAFVFAYILDTGIYAEHPDFGRRAYRCGSYISDSTTSDGHGHGTHVAGTIGSNTYGVNKHVRLCGIKVANRYGRSNTLAVIRGINRAIYLHNRRGGKGRAKSVINISLRFSPSSALDSAVRSAVNAGIPVVVSAGNANRDARNQSPAREPLAITVASIDRYDRKARTSNYGSRVDIIAPGEAILSTWKASSSRGRRETSTDATQDTTTDSTDNSVTDSMTGSVTESMAGSVTESMAGSVTESMAGSVTDSITESVTDSSTENINRLLNVQQSEVNRPTSRRCWWYPCRPTSRPTKVLSGTSMAAPHVAGVASQFLMMSRGVSSPAYINILLRIRASYTARGFNRQTTKAVLQTLQCRR